MPFLRILVLATAVGLAIADVQASDPASELLGRAEATVAEARSKQALWLEAARAIAAAQAALNRGDLAESERQSHRAIELSELGMLQREGGTGPAVPQSRRDQ